MEYAQRVNITLQQARETLEQGKYTCVLQRGDEVLTSTRRGVAPLLAWLDEGLDARGFVAADRVVGNGAAFLYVLLGVSGVYGGVMSKSAAHTLTHFGVEVSFGQMVDHIVNRTNTGCCPMEQAVRGIEEPHAAYEALVAQYAALTELPAEQAEER